MREEQELVLDDHDEEIVRLFCQLGLTRNCAKALVFLSHAREATSTEVEHGANLRQPEVSVAMQFLRDRGWVVKRDLKRTGKGRPIHAYSLSSPLQRIANDIEREKRDEAGRNLEALARLRKAVER